MSRLPARVLAAARVADDEDGRRRPVKDVVAPGRFLLIAGDGAIVVRPDRFIGLGAITLALLFGLFNLILGIWMLVQGIELRRTDKTLQSVRPGKPERAAA